MEELFLLYKGVLIIHQHYKGRVCGYSDSHFILAVITKDTDKFFRTVRKKEFYIDNYYKHSKYRYIYEDESVIEKQFNQKHNYGKKARQSRNNK
jgi:hypothetical protein